MLTVGNRLNHEAAPKNGGAASAPPARTRAGSRPRRQGRSTVLAVRARRAPAPAARPRPARPALRPGPAAVVAGAGRRARGGRDRPAVLRVDPARAVAAPAQPGRARITGTFHDVMSQSFSREPQDTREAPALLAGVAPGRARHESDDGRAARRGARLQRTRTPICSGTRPTPSSTRRCRPGTSRRTCRRARRWSSWCPTWRVTRTTRPRSWTIDHVWPLVHAARPDAVLRFIGGGASDELRDRVAGLPDGSGVVLAGFVDDLDAEYAAAAVALVPVLQGAGVKFKTVEALCHGVPVVTTTVGAEGIEGDDLVRRPDRRPRGSGRGAGGGAWRTPLRRSLDPTGCRRGRRRPTAASGSTLRSAARGHPELRRVRARPSRSPARSTCGAR